MSERRASLFRLSVSRDTSWHEIAFHITGPLIAVGFSYEGNLMRNIIFFYQTEQAFEQVVESPAIGDHSARVFVITAFWTHIMTLACIGRIDYIYVK